MSFDLLYVLMQLLAVSVAAGYGITLLFDWIGWRPAQEPTAYEPWLEETP